MSEEVFKTSPDPATLCGTTRKNWRNNCLPELTSIVRFLRKINAITLSHYSKGTPWNNKERSPQFPAYGQLSRTPQKDECVYTTMPHLFSRLFATGFNEKGEVGNRLTDICCDRDLLFGYKMNIIYPSLMVLCRFPFLCNRGFLGSCPEPSVFLLFHSSTHVHLASPCIFGSYLELLHKTHCTWM